MSKTIPRDQIPEEVLEEIQASFNKITWNNYGVQNLRLFQRSRRLKYKKVETFNTAKKVKDPWWFDDKMVHGLSHVMVTHYRLYGKVSGNSIDIYSVKASQEAEDFDRHLPT